MADSAASPAIPDPNPNSNPPVVPTPPSISFPPAPPPQLSAVAVPPPVVPSFRPVAPQFSTVPNAATYQNPPPGVVVAASGALPVQPMMAPYQIPPPGQTANPPVVIRPPFAAMPNGYVGTMPPPGGLRYVSLSSIYVCMCVCMYVCIYVYLAVFLFL